MQSGIPLRAVVALIVLAAAAGAVAANASRTAFPGKNGRILFNDQFGYLDLVNADGTGVVRLAATRAADQIIGASGQGCAADAIILELGDDATEVR